MFPLEREQIHSVEAIYNGVVAGLITNYSSSFFKSSNGKNSSRNYCILPPVKQMYSSGKAVSTRWDHLQLPSIASQDFSDTSFISFVR